MRETNLTKPIPKHGYELLSKYTTLLSRKRTELLALFLSNPTVTSGKAQLNRIQ